MAVTLYKDQLAKLSKTIDSYTIRFASSDEDRERLYQLRYQVFHEEFGVGSGNADGLDIDAYDEFSDHLIIEHGPTSQIIGTYRMQPYDKAIKHIGFYTEQEFFCHDFPESVLSDSIEIGRLCIQNAHRSRRVIMLLWKGLAMYLKAVNKNCLFGCSSIMTQSSDDAARAVTVLKENGFYHSEYLLRVQEKYAIQDLKENVPADGFSLPQLMIVYIKMGARICSLPAIDREFKTIDFLGLLDSRTLPAHQQNFFFT